MPWLQGVATLGIIEERVETSYMYSFPLNINSGTKSVYMLVYLWCATSVL